MNKGVYFLGGIAVLSFIIIGFFFPTSTPDQLDIQEARKSSGSKISVLNIERNAFSSLNQARKEEIRLLYNEINEEDSLNIEVYKQIAGKWFTFASPEMSGVFAEKIAKVVDNDTAWAMAGSTFYLALEKLEDGPLKEYCLEHALSNYDNAISINSTEMDYKISRTQIEIDYPPADNPMKGIKLLLGLNKKFPNSTKVLLRLAHLGMKTGQWEKAEARLLKILVIDERNKKAHCMLAEVYHNLNDKESSVKHFTLCN